MAVEGRVGGMLPYGNMASGGKRQKGASNRKVIDVCDVSGFRHSQKETHKKRRDSQN